MGQSAWSNPAGRIALAGGRITDAAVDRFLAAFRCRIPPPQAIFCHLNLLYSRLEEASFKEVTPGQIDDLKSRFQAPLGRLRRLQAGDSASVALRNRVVALTSRLSVIAYSKVETTVTVRKDLDREMDDVMEQLHQELDLRTSIGPSTPSSPYRWLTKCRKYF